MEQLLNMIIVMFRVCACVCSIFGVVRLVCNNCSSDIFSTHTQLVLCLCEDCNLTYDPNSDLVLALKHTFSGYDRV